jgi:integrase
VPCYRILREHLSAGGITGPFLLTSTRGDRFRATRLTTMICNARTDFGFPGYSPHGLPHLTGAALAEAGATLEQIKSILGHLTDDGGQEVHSTGAAQGHGRRWHEALGGFQERKINGKWQTYPLRQWQTH